MFVNHAVKSTELYNFRKDCIYINGRKILYDKVLLGVGPTTVRIQRVVDSCTSCLKMKTYPRDVIHRDLVVVGRMGVNAVISICERKHNSENTSIYG